MYQGFALGAHIGDQLLRGVILVLRVPVGAVLVWAQGICSVPSCVAGFGSGDAPPWWSIPRLTSSLTTL